jgi:hypothetical protein
MNLSKFFIDRPIFAGVLSVLILLAGLIALRGAADLRVPGSRAADRSWCAPTTRAPIPR